MKRQLAVTGLVASLAILGGSNAWAQFTSLQTAAVTAQAVTGGNKTAGFTLTVHPTASTQTVLTPQVINWTNVLPGSGWKIADQLMQLTWNVTDVSGGIQIYTDNTNGLALPGFVDPTPAVPVGNVNDPNGHNLDSNPAGLLYTPIPTPPGFTTSSALPIAWSIKDSTQNLAGATPQLQPSDPNSGPVSGPASKYQWLFMKDAKTPAIDLDGLNSDGVGTAWDDKNPDGTAKDGTAFANADPYVMMIGQSGIHGASGPTNFFSDTDKHSFVYMQADFTNAAAVSTYKTNRVIVEAFIL